MLRFFSMIMLLNLVVLKSHASDQYNNINMEESVSCYYLALESSLQYRQIEHVVTNITLTDKVSERIERKVPGIDYDGHSLLNLNIDQNNNVEMLIDIECSNYSPSKFSYKAQLSFLEGNCDGFMRGERVILFLKELGVPERDMMTLEGTKYRLSLRSRRLVPQNLYI